MARTRNSSRQVAIPTETLVQVVREHEIVDLEEAHWRLSALPARFAGFRDRGVLREGAPADIVVYDFDNLAVLPMEVARRLPGWRVAARAARATGTATCW